MMPLGILPKAIGAAAHCNKVPGISDTEAFRSKQEALGKESSCAHLPR